MRINGFEPVGRIGDEYYFADSVFQHSDFAGVTGTSVRPVSAEEYEWASDPENVAERYCYLWEEMHGSNGADDCEECGGHPDSDSGCSSCGVPSLDAWVDTAIRIDGIDHLMFDESYCCDASDAFDELGIEHETTDCTGGGRCFGRDSRGHSSTFDEVFNQEALDAIIDLEDNNGRVNPTAEAVFGRPMVSIMDDFDAWFDYAWEEECRRYAKDEELKRQARIAALEAKIAWAKELLLSDFDVSDI